MAGLAGSEASKMLIMSVLNREEHAGEGESTAMHGWQGVLQALISKALEALPAAGMPTDVGPAYQWKVLSILVGVAAVVSVVGIVYLLLSWCRCFRLRSSAAAKRGDI